LGVGKKKEDGDRRRLVASEEGRGNCTRETKAGLGKPQPKRGEFTENDIE